MSFFGPKTEEEILKVILEMERGANLLVNIPLYSPKQWTYPKPGSFFFGMNDPIHILKIKGLAEDGYFTTYKHPGRWRYHTYYIPTPKLRELLKKHNKQLPTF